MPRNVRDKSHDKAPAVLTRETPGLICETYWYLCCELVVLKRRKNQPINTIPATEESSVSTSSIPSTTSSSTTVATTTEYTYEEYIPEYDIDQTVLNVNFEDIYDLCEAWTGVDLPMF